jgi:hypothetical protein
VSVAGSVEPRAGRGQLRVAGHQGIAIETSLYGLNL